jgi:putative DNA primase/helicase
MAEIINMGDWDPQKARAETERRRKEMQEQARAEQDKKGGSGGGGDVPSEFVQQCLDANYLGDGMLFAYLHKGQYLFNHNTQEWLHWAGHYWALDDEDQVKRSVENLIPHYIKERARLEEQSKEAWREENKGKAKALQKKADKITGRIDRLRSPNGRNGCLEFAATCEGGLGIDGSILDQQPWLFPVANGVIDLRTGQHRPGRPDDYMTKSSPVEWQGLEAKRDFFNQFMLQIIGDEERIGFLQRWCGYCLTGSTREQRFLCMTGEGRNGKGALCELLNEVLGDLSGPVRAEMLLDQGRVQSSSGPSSDIMDLQGMRMAMASESDEGRRFSPSRIKWFTGGDTLVGRYPHDKRQTAFRPTHKLVLQTNNKPHAPADDFAFWARLLEVNFPYRFVDDPQAENERKRDNEIEVKLREELPGVLAWLVEGALLWQRDGLAPPDQILRDVEEYRREEDILQDWIDERCYLANNSLDILTSSTKLYEDFSDWFKTYQGARVPSGTWFGRRMSKKFNKTKANGVNNYYGIALLST